MAVTQTIPQTNLPAGQTIFNVNPTAQQWRTADVLINRTGSGNHPWLNTLTTGDTLEIDIQYSPDGGTTWDSIGGITTQGGTVVTKGVTITTDELSVGIGVLFPSGTQFRVITTASRTITISGTVTYDTPT